GRHRPMLPGRALAARSAGQNEIEVVREDFGLKRSASLRAAEHVGHLRPDERFVAGTGSAPRRRTCRSCHLEYVEGGAERKSIRRLEPERRTQNDHLRLFPSRQGRANRFHSRHVGWSRNRTEKEKGRSHETPL